MNSPAIDKIRGVSLHLIISRTWRRVDIGAMPQDKWALQS
jgi:hypothetical protein